jgi:hypothetical protein
MAWIVMTALIAAVGVVTTARIVRVRTLSRPTVAAPEQVREELLAFVSRQDGSVVDLRPFWAERDLTEADRWTVQGPLHQSGQLLAADEDASLFGRLRAYVRAPLPEHVVLATSQAGAAGPL